MATVGADDESECLTTRRGATHWLFSRLVGVVGVSIPDSALFHDEGVLTAWLHTTALVAAAARPKQKHPAKSATKVADAEASVVRSHDVLELSLLRLEAHFQDLVKQQRPAQSQGHTVAVVYDDDDPDDKSPPHMLNEAALDSVVRALCARQRSMTALEPDHTVARAYKSGRFVLQAAAFTPRDTVTVITCYSADADHARDGFDHEVQRRSSPLSKHDGGDDGRNEEQEEEEEEAIRRWRKSIDWSGAFARAEAQSRAVLWHLKAAFGVSLRRLTLEFAGPVTGPSQSITLVCARRIEWHGSHGPRPSATTAKRRNPLSQPRGTQKAEVATTTTVRQRAHAFRVCRQCRTPVDVEIARELLQQQTLVRDVLAKYQAMSARHADAETRCVAATDRAAHCETRVARLESEIVRLREQLDAENAQKHEVVEQKHSVELQLLEAAGQTQQAERQVQDANAQIAQLLREQSNQIHEVEQSAETQQRAWQEQDAQRDQEMHTLRDHVTFFQSKCVELQEQLEEARAAGDELRFQWAFVARKLTDVGDAGVLPPKRVAGGYSSYPTPTAANVEQVVKWIVDYEARRTVLDAQQRRVGSPGKSVTRRLQMKVELMRLLHKSSTKASASPPSPSRRRCTRRKSSRSPQKKTSPTRQIKEAAATTTTLVHEQQTKLVWAGDGSSGEDD